MDFTTPAPAPADPPVTLTGLNLPPVSTNFQPQTSPILPSSKAESGCSPSRNPQGTSTLFVAATMDFTEQKQNAAVPKSSGSSPSRFRAIADFDSTSRAKSYAAIAAPKVARKPDVLVHRCSMLQPEKCGDLVTLTIPRDIFQKRVQEFEFAVIGRLLLRKGDTPRTLNDLKTELSRLWQPTGKWKIILMSKSFYTIQFTSSEDKLKAKAKPVWELSTGSFRVRDWVRNFDPYKEISSVGQVWVRIFCLPVEYWVPEVLAGIGRSLGTPIKVDNATAFGDVGHYARILVEVDLALPLQESIMIDCDDNSFHVEFEFEKLPLFCYKCLIIGHSVDKCKKNAKPTSTIDAKVITAAQVEADFQVGKDGVTQEVKSKAKQQVDSDGFTQVKAGRGPL